MGPRPDGGPSPKSAGTPGQTGGEEGQVVNACPVCLGTGKVLDQAAQGEKARRLRNGLSQAYVARKMGITPSYLNYLESGKRPWSTQLWQSFQAALK